MKSNEIRARAIKQPPLIQVVVPIAAITSALDTELCKTSGTIPNNKQGKNPVSFTYQVRNVLFLSRI